ncbi:MAG: cytochrome b/b6 domain-containing protein [Bacteriovorax sp.]|nr:cytochrome b/b6 domain-containing protein [Bacteriovorax sp.]
MKVERKKIYDPLLRLSHFGIAFFCLILILSAYIAEFYYEEGLLRKSFWVVHVYSGFALTFFLILRIFWGLIGPKYARWHEMWKWQEWKGAFKARRIHFKWNWGHHPMASLSYLLFYFILSFLSVTGIILSAIEHNLGPLASSFYDQLTYRKDLSELHESLSYFVILFIFSHLFALFWHENKDQIPIVQSMFSGFQYRKNNEVKNEDEKYEDEKYEDEK